MKKKILMTLAAIILVPLAWIIYGSIDEERREFPELVPQRVEVSDEENAYNLIKDRLDEIREASNRYLDQKEENATIQLTEYQEIYDLIDQMLVKKSFLVPAVLNFDNPQDHLSRLRTLAKFQYWKIQDLQEKGNLETAVVETEKALKLASLFQKQPETLVDYLVRIACLAIANSSVNQLVKTGKLDKGQLLRLQKQLEAIPQDFLGWESALQSEHYMVSTTMFDQKLTSKQLKMLLFMTDEEDQAVYQFMGSSRYGFHPNRACNLYSQFIASFITIKEANFKSVKLPRVIEGAESSEEVAEKGIWMPNGFGVWMISDSEAAFDKSLRKLYESWARLRLVDLGIACQLYKLDHQEFPSSFEELTPKYIKEIPLDPMDGKPLRYNSKDKILYSVGHDFKDNGGKSDDEMNSSYSPDEAKDFTLYLLPREE